MEKRVWSIVFFCSLSYAAISQIFFENTAIELGVVNSGGTVMEPGGVSFVDYDQDGWDDVTIGGKTVSQPLRFFKNNGGVFVEEVFNFTITGIVKQIAWVDYDNDGDNDLFVVVHNGSNKLLQNDGNFVFTDVTSAAGLPTNSLKTYGASFGDYDNDGYLDLFLSNLDYLEVIPNYLFRNNGDGTFSNVSTAAGIGNASNFSFASAFFDYDNDGFQDIYVINDRVATKNVLYHNEGDGTFTDVSVDSGTDIQIDAMSTAIEDYDYDGWLDIYVTNTSSGNYLLKNNGNGTFTNVAVSTGTVLNRFSWGANFFDADNDLDLDLYVSTAESTITAFFERLTNSFFQVPNPSTTGFSADMFYSVANAIGDLNNDGYVDILVNNRAPANSSLWRNAGGTNNWLKVKLQGVISNRNGIGSWIEVFANGQVMYRYTLCGESFIGQNSMTEFFGLGDATTIDYIKVKWLSGIEDVFNNVAINQTLTIIEGSGTLSNTDDAMASIKIVPNPTTGILKFLNLKNVVEVQIFDISGRAIETRKIHLTHPEVDISSFSKGIYFFEIKSEYGSITKKIILH